MYPNNEDLARKLGELSPQTKLAFFLLLCDRMYPALEKFCAETGFNIYRYKEYLEIGWHCLNKKLSNISFEEASQYCYKNAPDTESSQHALVSAALNSALSIGLLMDFISDDDVDHVIEASELARDTVALHVQNVHATQPFSLDIAKVIQHPMLQAELRRQEEDFYFLSSLPKDIGSKEIIEIKSRSKSAPELIPLGKDF